MTAIVGEAHKFGDHVDTDQIIPARYLTSTDEKFLASHCMEVADPEFVNKVKSGDIMVAGVNFGCGSSREHAPIAIRASGISCIIAKSFARIFFRNSINRGLPVLECPEIVDITEINDKLEVDLIKGTVTNITKAETFQFKAFEPFMMELLNSGGLISFTLRKLHKGSE